MAAGRATGFPEACATPAERSETGFQRPRVEPLEIFFLPKGLLCMSELSSGSELANDKIDSCRWYRNGGQVFTTPKSLTGIGIEDLSTLLPHGVHGTPSEARLLFTYFHIRRCSCLSILSS